MYRYTMKTRKSTLKNIVSGCVVRSEHHVDTEYKISRERTFNVFIAIYRKICLFLGFNKEVQMEPPKASTQSETFQGRVCFGKSEHFNKQFVNNLRTKGPAGESFGVFSPRYSKNYILNGEFNTKMDTIWTLFFSKIRAHFIIFEKRQERSSSPPPPLIMRLKDGL